MSKCWITKNSAKGLPKVANKAQEAMGCVNHSCRNTTMDGYGVVTDENDPDWGYRTAHKLAYTQSLGIEYDALPKGKIQHTCKNKRCINPEHMQFTPYSSYKEGIRLEAHNARLARLALTVPNKDSEST